MSERLGITPLFSDITIIVENTEYKLHRIMLLRLPFFKDLFLSEFSDKKANIIILDEINKDGFENIIFNLYKNNILPTYNKLDQNLIDSAMFLGMNKELYRLLDELEQYIQEMMDYHEAMLLGEIGRHESDKLRDRLLDMFDTFKVEKYFLLASALKIPFAKNWLPKEIIQWYGPSDEVVENYYLTHLYLSARKYLKDGTLPYRDISKFYQQYYDYEGELNNKLILEDYINQHQMS